jgi:AraC-like DNA-binding protein
MPLKIDLYALFIFLGIAQGVFLGYFFLFDKKNNLPSNKLLGFILIGFSLANTEIFLCYTNLMFDVVWLTDFSEPLNYAFAPLLYLYLKSKVDENQIANWNIKQYWHFLPFFIYALYTSLIFFPQNIDFKYNAYISAYHPNLPRVDNVEYWNDWRVFWLKDHVNEGMLIHMFVYFSLSIFLIVNVFKQNKLPFFSYQNPNLAWCRNLLIKFLSIIVIFIIVKLNFKRDLGDHILAAHIALVVYMVSFQIVKQSDFFKKIPLKEEEKQYKKYEKSSLTTEIQENTLAKLDAFMKKEKPFLASDFSLPNLAQKLSVSPHHLSQILNEQLQQNFFEFAAYYRIEEAKNILQNMDNQHLKIEEIAEMVGYNSKSSFNTSFKKLVGRTPSEFRKMSV